MSVDARDGCAYVAIDGRMESEFYLVRAFMSDGFV
jgi:hypothetical protein